MYKCEHYTQTIFYQIEQTAKYCRFLGAQVFHRLNMPVSPDEFAAMDVIYAHGAMCQRELAQLILKDRPNTGRILSSLEDKGYIERFVDTKNNRLVRKMKLTPTGEAMTIEVSKALREYISKLPKIFSEEDKADLMDLIKRFRVSLEKEVEMKI